MVPPSERDIALFLSQTSSTRNRALLYLGITNGNVDDAVSIFNRKPDESFRAAFLRPAGQFRRPLANGATGYEDKDGVLHLETFTEDESDDEVEGIGELTGEYKQGDIYEPIINCPPTKHPLPRARASENGKELGTIRRSISGSKFPVDSTKIGEKKACRAAYPDSTSEPEELSPPFSQASHTGRDKFPQISTHRCTYARELGVPGFEGAGNTNPISAHTRTSLRKAGRLPKIKQSSCVQPRKKLSTHGSRNKGVIDDTFLPALRTKKQNRVIPVTPVRRSKRRQTPAEYEAHVTAQKTAQSRFQQAKKNTSGGISPRTSSTGVSSDSYQSSLCIPSSKLKRGNMTSSNRNPQRNSGEILDSSFRRASFESMSPLAMESGHDNESNTSRNQRNTSDIPLLELYNSNKSNTREDHQRGTSEIPLQDMYLAPPSSVSNFSFLSALNLAREKKKWLLVNIQSANLPACGILNRDIWRHPDIADIVSQSFILLQLNYDDERADGYFERYYGALVPDEGEGIESGSNRKTMQLPHISLLDPVSGHRWKVWDGPGLPDKDLFLADMCEYEMVGEGEWCEWGTGVIREMD